MSEILVVHGPLMAKGGGEAVCMNVLEALQDEHEVTLLTTGNPDFNELNKYYNTSVTDIELETLDWMTTLVHSISKNRLGRLKASLMNRYIMNQELGEDYDLIFSTYNDLRIRYDSVQYIHMPNFDRTAFPGIENGNIAHEIYDIICDFIMEAETRKDVITYLANSDWSADHVMETLGKRPTTVYPPVDTSEFEPIEWTEREDGFVTIGRVSDEKNILRNIEIIARLRNQGYDIHYHIIGPTVDQVVPSFSDDYEAQVRNRVSKYDFVHFEGEVSRERLVEMISTHKFGLHGMEHEHFGIAVAELVAGGTIPFVPNNGGQKEVVGHCEDVLYNSVDDAVEKIGNVLDDEPDQQKIRQQLPDIEEEFGDERFKQEIKNIVDQKLT